MRNRRRRRQARKFEDESSLWQDAVVRQLEGYELQIVGIGSPTSAAFARILMGNDVPKDSSAIGDVVEKSLTSRSITLAHAVELVLEETARLQHAVPLNAFDLFRLGSVWLLPSSGYDCSARRVSADDVDVVPKDWSKITLRIHYNPPRFPSAWRVRDAIVHEDKECGFTILNKPGGVPSHATVDNGSENALSMFQATMKYPISRGDRNKVSPYAILPQRLDTETSGLLVISTQREFTAFVSKLLQRKTLGHTLHDAGDVDSRDFFGITKHYRCLVCIRSIDQVGELMSLKSTKQIVTHFTNSQSSAPKPFISERPADIEIKDNWLECQLAIVNVSVASSVSSRLEHHLWTSKELHKPSSCSFVVELEIELYTGRTHQIRGQLRAMGFPIVGDQLYGGGTNISSVWKRGTDSMALQCCSIKFPCPVRSEIQGKKGKCRRSLVPSAKEVAFSLDRAWWTEFLDGGC